MTELPAGTRRVHGQGSGGEVAEVSVWYWLGTMCRRCGVQGGSLAIVAAGFLPWFRLDTGASFTGYRLADAVYGLDESIDLLPGRWVALSWYLVVVIAVVSWMSVYIGAVGVSTRHLYLGGIGALPSVAFVVVAVRVPTIPLAGPVIVLAGALLIALSGWVASTAAPSGVLT